MIVSEVFGPTIQGEGPSAGHPAMFVRLGLCNLDCHVCDTPYTWDWLGKNGVAYDRGELMRMEAEEVAAWARPHMTNGRLLVITGGEPLVQRADVAALVTAVLGAGDIEIETNGTLAPLSRRYESLTYNVSPKTSAMLVNAPSRLGPHLGEYLAHRSRFKFVVRTLHDVLEVDTIVQANAIPDERVWLMPEGRTAAQLNDLLPQVIAWALERGYNVSHRLHVLAWGDVRGR